MVTIGSIEQKEKTITASLRQKLALLTLELAVEQDRRLDGIPAVHVVWRGLKIPGELSRVRIQSDDGASVKIVAGPRISGEHGAGIARAPVEQLQPRVIHASHPQHPPP